MGNDQTIILAVVIITLAIFILVVGIVVVMLSASRQRARQEATLAHARLSYEQELRTIEAETTEATLTQISAELHDNIGQLLTVIRLQIEKAQLVTPAAVPILTPISGSLNNAIRQVRLLSHALNTDFVGDGGLIAIIGSEVQRLQAIGTHRIAFLHPGSEPELSKDQRTVVFRIVQELLSNALRHASATEITLTLTPDANTLLTLADNGKGFDKTATLETSHGLGLKNMLRRAGLAGLALSIDTAPGQGSTFIIGRQPAR